MSAREIIAVALLVPGVVVLLLSCVGVLTGRNAYARLHYIGPSTLLGSTLIAGAILVRESLGPGGIKAGLTVLILVLTGPVISHATARAVHTLQSRRREDR